MRPALANGLAIFAIGLATLPLSALIFVHRADPPPVALPPAQPASFVPGSAPGPVVAVPPPHRQERPVPPAPPAVVLHPAVTKEAPKAALSPSRPSAPAPTPSHQNASKPVQKTSVAVLPPIHPLPAAPAKHPAKPKAAITRVVPSAPVRKPAVAAVPTARPAPAATTQTAKTKVAPSKPATSKPSVAIAPPSHPPASASKRAVPATTPVEHSSIVVVPRRKATAASPDRPLAVTAQPSPLTPEAQARVLDGAAASPYLAQGRRLTDWLYGNQHLDWVWAAFRPTVKAGWNNSLNDFRAYREEGQQAYGDEARVLRETVVRKGGTTYYLRTAVFERDPNQDWTVVFGLGGEGRVTEFGVVRAGTQ